MSKALCSFPQHERVAVIMKRLRAKTMGLGYWAAKDAARKLLIKDERKHPHE